MPLVLSAVDKIPDTEEGVAEEAELEERSEGDEGVSEDWSDGSDDGIDPVAELLAEQLQASQAAARVFEERIANLVRERHFVINANAQLAREIYALRMVRPASQSAMHSNGKGDTLALPARYEHMHWGACMCRKPLRPMSSSAEHVACKRAMHSVSYHRVGCILPLEPPLHSPTSRIHESLPLAPYTGSLATCGACG